MSNAELVGNPKGTAGRWNDPAAWADGTVPQSSDGLHVLVDVFSYANVGSQSSPFQTNDIIGATKGLFLGIGGPNPFAPGFLQAHDIQGMASVFLANGSALYVRHDLDSVDNLSLHSSDTVEIGHDIGSTVIEFRPYPGQVVGSTLILDHPAHSSLDNQIVLGKLSPLKPPTQSIELGGITFDHADLIPPAPGSTNEQIHLTNNGVSAYDLTHVAGAASVSFGGVDPTTGYDILLVSA